MQSVTLGKPGNGQHGAELVNIDDFDAGLIAARVVGERIPVPAPLEANRSVALGHRARQSQTLALLQVPGTHERNDFWPNFYTHQNSHKINISPFPYAETLFSQTLLLTDVRFDLSIDINRNRYPKHLNK